jgi:hypothetical protein
MLQFYLFATRLSVFQKKHEAHSIGAPRQHMRKIKKGLESDLAKFSGIPRHDQSWSPASLKKSTFWRSWRISCGISSELVSVTSLDQLFFQAWCLSPILLKKTKSWALQFKGCFPFQGTANDREEMDESGPQIKWGKVKSIHRAIEKAVRAYDQVHTLVLQDKLAHRHCQTLTH